MDEAQLSVNALVERKHPLIWEIGDVKRVLDPTMDTGPQVLLFLYQHPEWVSESDLLRWTEHSTASNFRRVLRKLHKERSIEFDDKRGRAQISPLGIEEVETCLLKTRS